MKIELEDQESDIMMQLIFLGIEVVNVNRNPPPTTPETRRFNRTFEKLLTQYIADKEGKRLTVLSDELFGKYQSQMEKDYSGYLFRYNQSVAIDDASKRREKY